MLRSFIPLLVLILTLTMGSTACETAPAPAPAEPPSTPQPLQQAPAPDPTPAVTPSIAITATPSPGASGDRMAARHILVAHEAAAHRPMHVHRSASAARAKAEDLEARLARGEDFAELAKAESDCTTSARGGFLGGFDRGTMEPAFEDAAFALAEGQTSGVVESPFGFHIILREPLMEIRVEQILVGFAGSQGDRTGRAREQALAIAQAARERLDGGEAFGSVAAELSDGAAGLRGGDLGWFTRGQFLPDWEDQAFALEPGATAGPFETGAGYHVIRRVD